MMRTDVRVRAIAGVRRRRKGLIAAAALALLVIPPGGPGTTVRAQDGPAAGDPAGVLRDAGDAAAELSRLYSLLVHWRGELVFERYYNGRRATSLANVKSASKSVVSALVGIAIDRGLISGVDQKIAEFFPEQLTAASGAAKRAITVEDLLTMRSGLRSTSNRYYGAWVQSRNWVDHALGRPLLAPPGTSMQYSTGNTHLLSAILTKVSGSSTWQFARETLADPLGIALARWPQDPQGIYFGGNDMLLTPRQMVAFGRLYLDGGLLDGKRIVPADWVETSVVPRTRSPISGEAYGYGWWVRQMAGHDAFYAWGYGGQYIFVVPDLELVVVTTSSATAGDERRGHRRTVDEIVEELVVGRLAAVIDGGASSASPGTGEVFAR